MAHISKIIIFIQAHFNQRDYDRFGINTLIENGFDVEVWDFTPFLTTAAYQMTQPPDPISWDKLMRFGSKKEALAAISNLTTTCFIIPVIQYNLATLAIFRMLSKKGISYSTNIMSCVIAISTTRKQHLKKRLKRLSLKELVGIIFRRIPFELLGVRPARVILAPAEKYTTGEFPVNNRSEILWLHSLDYDLYLKERENPELVDPHTGVFIDQYSPFHPDNLYVDGRVPKTTSEEYYPKLCSFFDHLETTFGVQIVIAAHPRSHYDKHSDFFGGRPVIRGKTAELARKSGFIIMHNSVAINFAVLFRKPLIFITTDRINDSFIHGTAEDPSVVWLASYFGKRTHNLDYDINIRLKEELIVEEDRYLTYINDYIKKEGTQDKPYWEIFARYIKGLGSENQFGTAFPKVE